VVHWRDRRLGRGGGAPCRRVNARRCNSLTGLPQTPITGVRDRVAPRFGGLGLGRYGLDRSDGRLV